jgi:hypothetical protein
MTPFRVPQGWITSIDPYGWFQVCALWSLLPIAPSEVFSRHDVRCAPTVFRAYLFA